MALLADAAHNLSDVVGLLLARGAVWAGRRRPTARNTYGWGRVSILASLANAVLLLLSCGAITVEALHRVGEPQPVAGSVVMGVAALGILINGGTALLFARGWHGDLNICGAFLHMAADAAVSAGVVLAGLAIRLTGQTWMDPATGLLVVAVITWGTWGLLRDSVGLALDRVPSSIDPAVGAAESRALPGVVDVHDSHIWALSTTRVALTAHLVTAEPHRVDAAVEAAGEVARRYGIATSPSKWKPRPSRADAHRARPSCSDGAIGGTRPRGGTRPEPSTAGSHKRNQRVVAGAVVVPAGG